MTQVINKLGELKKIKSFIQINTIKGFKYVDRAGEIVNRYCKNDKAPEFVMNLQGLNIKKPIEKISEIKISSNVIWCFFEEIDTFDSLIYLFNTESSNILEILDINKVSRIGWRNHFVYECKNIEEQKKYLNKFQISDNLKMYNISFKIDTKKDFEANLFIQPVVKEDKEYKTYGLFFDIDIYKCGEIDIDNIKNILSEYNSYLKDNEGFLKILNEIV